MDSKSSSSPLEIPPLLLGGLLLVCIVAFTAFTLWVVFRKCVENQVQTEGATTGGIGENDEDQRFGGMDSKKSAQKRQKTMMQKVIHGSMAGLVIFTAPFYALGFGLIGYKNMWRISNVIYGISRPSESILHDHFDRMQKFLATGTKEAALKSKAYMIHPTFAGLSLISLSNRSKSQWCVTEYVQYLWVLKSRKYVISQQGRYPNYDGWRRSNHHQHVERSIYLHGDRSYYIFFYLLN
eukprot:scaffold2143_cov79-Skeletonema_dohrnii-CCMP3373.AAC.1